MSRKSLVLALLMREYTENRVPCPRLDLRCPHPETRNELENFVTANLSNYHHWVARIQWPEWVNDLHEDDASFIGEALLMSYPALEELPDFFEYPISLLEQYTASKWCRLSELKIPEDVCLVDGELCPLGQSICKMSESLAPSLRKINLCTYEPAQQVIASHFVTAIADGTFPRLEHLKMDLSNMLDYDLVQRLFDRMSPHLEFTGYLRQSDGQEAKIASHLDFLSKIPSHRKNLKIYAQVPLNPPLADLASLYATHLKLSSRDLELPTRVHVFQNLTRLHIEFVDEKHHDHFLEHLSSMEMPSLVEIQIHSLVVLGELPNMLRKTRRLVRLTVNCNLSGRVETALEIPPLLSREFKSDFLGRLCASHMKMPGHFQPWSQHDAPEDGEAADEFMFVGRRFISHGPISARARLQNMVLRSRSRFLMAEILENLGQEVVGIQELDLEFDTVGSFTAVFLKFLLVSRGKKRVKLRFQPQTLTGGLTLNLIPVVLGLARNWDVLSVGFECPREYLTHAHTIVKRALVQEMTHHSSIRIVVNCDDSSVFGEGVNGKSKVCVSRDPHSSLFFGNIRKQGFRGSELFGAQHDLAKQRLLRVSSVLLKQISRRAILDCDQLKLERITDACDHRTSSEIEVRSLLRKLDVLFRFEREASTTLIEGLLAESK
ncbi:hypothetical protein HDE_12471 [Halotydeus destructor]|nr:hypothetical protein HDE_12471 [Halotydeus destructor]